MHFILIGLLATAIGALAQTDPSATIPAAPDIGTITSSNLLQDARDTNQEAIGQYFQVQMDLAIRQRHDKRPKEASETLVGIIKTNAPPEFKRKALFELALATQDIPDLVKAEQIFGQYIHLYPDDPSAPEVLLRQGLIYRQMGVNTMAISKFYGVMSTALKLKLSNIDYYKRLVLQSQTEIADTYYMEGDFADAGDFYARILKGGNPSLNKELVLSKLVRSLSYLTNNVETIVRAQTFLDEFTNSANVAEIRFILASAYKGVGRNQDALKQVLLLLQSQQANVRNSPDVWAYWQRRAGNDIANQLYKEGDYPDALQIYQCMAALDDSINWKAPVWYQIGLVYEQLQQWDKATNYYGQIIAKQKDPAATNSPPSMAALCEMAQWRTDYIVWAEKARLANHEFQRSALYSTNKISIQ
ncbi:MAG TPA: tetratricopeptide repeat protein [Verrucomicrobiae bacterium]|jgi:tetratricopeptide (TPR) repeat protein|nr:tetratricopeptide repeat protein [Verrucomicrobiae bacterium]